MGSDNNVVVPFKPKGTPDNSERARAEATGALSARANVEAVLIALGNAVEQCETRDVLTALVILRTDRASDGTAQAVATDAALVVLERLVESQGRGKLPR